MFRVVNIALIIFTLTAAVLSQSGGVKGRVRGPNEKGLGGVEISAEFEGKVVKTTTTESNGSFSIYGLADGRYKLSFDKPGFGYASYRFSVEKGKIVDLSGRNFVLETDRGTQVVVQGSVFDEIGMGIPYAKVEIHRFTAGGVWERARTMYTETSGEFLFRFPEGKSTKYRVTVSYEGVEPVAKEKETDFAGIYRLVFNLPVKINKAREVSNQ